MIMHDTTNTENINTKIAFYQVGNCPSIKAAWSLFQYHTSVLTN